MKWKVLGSNLTTAMMNFHRSTPQQNRIKKINHVVIAIPAFLVLSLSSKEKAKEEAFTELLEGAQALTWGLGGES